MNVCFIVIFPNQNLYRSAKYTSVQFSCSVVSGSLWSHGLQHTRLPCPSPTPGACSNSCLLSWWCQPTISSSVVPFSSCLQPFPASRSFPMSQFFSSNGSSSHQLQSIGASSASTSVLPCFQGLISKGLSSIFQHHSSKTSVLRCSFPYGPTHICGEIIIEIKKMISAKFRLPLVGKERAGPWWGWQVCHRAWFIVSSVKWKIHECSLTIILKPSLYVICTLIYKYPLEFWRHCSMVFYYLMWLRCQPSTYSLEAMCLWKLLEFSFWCLCFWSFVTSGV